MSEAFKRFTALIRLRFVESACEGDSHCHAQLRDLLAVPDLWAYGSSSDWIRTDAGDATRAPCCSTEGLRVKT